MLIFDPLPTLDESVRSAEGLRYSGVPVVESMITPKALGEKLDRQAGRLRKPDMLDMAEVERRTGIKPDAYRALAQNGKALLFVAPEAGLEVVPEWSFKGNRDINPVAIAAAKVFRTYCAESWADRFADVMTDGAYTGHGQSLGYTVTYDPARILVADCSLAATFNTHMMKGPFAVTQSIADALAQISGSKHDHVAERILSTLKAQLGKNAGVAPLAPLTLSGRPSARVA